MKGSAAKPADGSAGKPGVLSGDEMREIARKAHDENRAISQGDSASQPRLKRTAITPKARHQIMRWLAPTTPEIEKLEEERKAATRKLRNPTDKQGITR